MGFKPRFIIRSLFYLVIAISFFTLLGALSAQSFDNSTTTNSSSLQNFIDTTSTDTEIVFQEGNYTDALSNLNITKSLSIRGEGTVNIISTSGGILFNVSTVNVNISNLNIIGYNTAISSNESNIQIKDNIINTTDISINFNSINDFKNIWIENNTIFSENGININGKYLENILFINNFIYSNDSGISLRGDYTHNTSFLNNTIHVSKSGDYNVGISLFSSASELIFHNNSIFSYHGISIGNGFILENASIQYNNISAAIGIILRYAFDAQVPDLKNISISNNIILINISADYLTFVKFSSAIYLVILNQPFYLYMEDIFIEKNNITIFNNDSVGIYFYNHFGSINNISIRDNNISQLANNTIAIYLEVGDNSTIDNVTIFNNSIDISVDVIYKNLYANAILIIGGTDYIIQNVLIENNFINISIKYLWIPSGELLSAIYIGSGDNEGNISSVELKNLDLNIGINILEMDAYSFLEGICIGGYYDCDISDVVLNDLNIIINIYTNIMNDDYADNGIFAIDICGGTAGSKLNDININISIGDINGNYNNVIGIYIRTPRDLYEGDMNNLNIIINASNLEGKNINIFGIYLRILIENGNISDFVVNESCINININNIESNDTNVVAVYIDSDYVYYVELTDFNININVSDMNGNDNIVAGIYFLSDKSINHINISSNKIVLESSNFFNTTGVLTKSNSITYFNMSYNRVLSDKGLILSSDDSNNYADYNWWGDNNATDYVYGITLDNYFIVNVTNTSSFKANQSATFNYTFVLNDSSPFDYTKLPYFETYILYINGSGELVTIAIDARISNSSIIIPTVGLNHINISFITDNEKFLFNADFYNTNITIDEISGKYNETISITATFNSTGGDLTGKNISFYYYNSTTGIVGDLIGSNFTSSDGKVTTSYFIGSAGDFEFIAIFTGESLHVPSNATKIANFIKINTTVIVFNVSGKRGDKVNLTANLTDEYGNGLVGQLVVFYVDGNVVGNNTTGLDGSTRLEITLNASYFEGNHNINASFMGNGNYSECTIDQILNLGNLTVNLFNSSISIVNLTGKYNDIIYLVANLSNDSNNGISNALIEFWIGGTNVANETTNSVGIANVSWVVLSAGNFSYEAIFRGNVNYTSFNTSGVGVHSANFSKINTKLFIDSADVDWNEEVIFIVNLTDGFGSPISNKLVFFYLNDTKIGNNTTNTNGIASYTYHTTLPANNYYIYANFENDGNYSDSISNIDLLTVNKRMAILDLYASEGYKVGDIIKLEIDLYYNPPIAHHPVILKLNGNKIAEISTDLNGKAVYYYTITSIGVHTFSAEYVGSDVFTDSTFTLPDKIISESKPDSDPDKGKIPNINNNNLDFDYNTISKPSLSISLLNIIEDIIDENNENNTDEKIEEDFESNKENFESNIFNQILNEFKPIIAAILMVFLTCSFVPNMLIGGLFDIGDPYNIIASSTSSFVSNIDAYDGSISPDPIKIEVKSRGPWLYSLSYYEDDEIMGSGITHGLGYMIHEYNSEWEHIKLNVQNLSKDNEKLEIYVWKGENLIGEGVSDLDNNNNFDLDIFIEDD